MNMSPIDRYTQSRRRKRWLWRNMPVLSEGDVFYISEFPSSFVNEDLNPSIDSYLGKMLTVSSVEFPLVKGTRIPHYTSIEEGDGWLWSVTDIDIEKTLLAKGVELIPDGEVFLFRNTAITSKPDLPEI